MTAAVAERYDAWTVAEIVDRAARPDLDRWADQVARCGHCSRPVRMRGFVDRPDGTRYTTDAEPDQVLLIRCGNRRASVCSNAGPSSTSTA